jgi:hypothetical protein
VKTDIKLTVLAVLITLSLANYFRYGKWKLTEIKSIVREWGERVGRNRKGRNEVKNI